MAQVDVFSRTYHLAAGNAFVCKTSDPGIKSTFGLAVKGQYADGFVAEEAGDVVYRAPGDTADKTITVVVGQPFTGKIASIAAGTTADIVLGWIR